MSDKIAINEEMNLQEEWYKDAKDQTIETLPSFIRHVLDDYCHDYGTICHAIAACGIASMWAANKHPSAGITGFQAGAVMWEVIRHWMYTSNTCGLRIVDYDDMLFPQYRSKYEKTIR